MNDVEKRQRAAVAKSKAANDGPDHQSKKEEGELDFTPATHVTSNEVSKVIGDDEIPKEHSELIA